MIIPKFLKITPLQLFWLLLFLMLPNVLLFGIAWLSHTSRPLLNVDYVWVGLLFWLPRWWGKALAGVAFVLAVTLDCLMLAAQIYPFLDVHAIQYFLPFIHVTPTPYLLGIGLMLLYAVLMPMGLSWLAGRQNRFYWAGLAVLLVAVSPYFGVWKYRDAVDIVGRHHHYYLHSQARLYRQWLGDDLTFTRRPVPKITPSGAQQAQASAQLKQPYADKILLIVVESWGSLKHPAAQQQILQQLTAQQHRFEWLEQGNFQFVGSTVNGELRELCHFYAKSGYQFTLLDDKVFEHCLPMRLQKQGYRTIGIHGASGLLYDRVAWYPKAGFQQTLFGEQFADAKRCITFHSVCDNAMMAHISPLLKQHSSEKLFIYWLTVTAHQPYALPDIHNMRFDCMQFGMIDNGEICRNARLHTQFFDGLAQWVQQPEMQGVEVLLVGDHMPPMMLEDTRQLLHWNTVSWLHFKVKRD